MERIVVSFTDDLCRCKASGCEVTEIEYGWQLHEASYSEWVVTVQFTGRQDGRTSWLVSLTDCDGLVRVATGLNRSDGMPAVLVGAMQRLATEAGWCYAEFALAAE